MRTIKSVRCKKGRAYKKGTGSVYDKYTAAGSFQSIEFCNLTRRCVLRSSSMKELMSRDSGTVGMITYLRTDSTRISEEADANARSYIAEHYGRKYVGSRTAPGKVAVKKIQDAHEAIRPTDITRTAGYVEGVLVQRPVPPVSADLETFCCKPYDACSL